MNYPNVVLRVDRNPDGLTQDPVVRQRFGPQRVHFESWSRNRRGVRHAPLFQKSGRPAQHNHHTHNAGGSAMRAFHMSTSWSEAYYYTGVRMSLSGHAGRSTGATCRRSAATNG